MPFAEVLTSVLPLAVFGAVTAGIWAGLSLGAAGRRREGSLDQRLDALNARPVPRFGAEFLVPKSELVDDLFRQAVPRLSSVMQPKGVGEAGRLRLKLSHAGFNSPAAVPAYLALKTLGMAAGAVVAGAAGAAFFRDLKNAAVSTVVGAAVGLWLPDLVLRWVASRRQERIFLALPEAVDLLVICVEVGRGLDGSLGEIVRELGPVSPDLCDELELYSRQTLLGRAPAEALQALGARSGVKDMHSLASVLIQSKRFGSSIADTLRELAEGMRIKRRQLAEERAQKTAVKLLFPLILFIFPGVFVVLVGPAALAVMRDMLTVR